MSTFSVSEAQYGLLSAGVVLVVDVECTCGPGITSDVQDIFQLGVLPLIMGVPPSAEHATTVPIRPQRSAITEFCTRLTGATPEAVEAAHTYRELSPWLAEMHTRLAPDAWLSWGSDHLLIQQQNEAFGTEGPFVGIQHIDMRRLLTPLIYELTGLPRPKGSSAGVGLQTALQALGLAFEGRHHNAGADAYNAARVLVDVRKRVADRVNAPGVEIKARDESAVSVTAPRQTLH